MVGASTAGQLAEVLASSALALPPDVTRALDAVSAPYIGAPETSWAVPAASSVLKGIARMTS